VQDGDVCLLPISEVAPLIQRRELSVSELVELTLGRIARMDSRLNSFITVSADAARGAARRLDDLIARGTYLGPLHGIPVALKDNILTRGVRTTAGTPILREWVPDSDATSWSRLQTAGAVLVGKNNLWEFAFGGPHQDYGEVPNPWDLTRACAGTSSGSASSVASGLTFASLGTDTGGSVRVPAAFCGIVGLKPTFGRVSKVGVIPVSYSMDHVCPMTRTVRDCAIILQAIAGQDPADRTTSPVPPPDYLKGIDDGVRGMRIGLAIPKNIDPFDPKATEAVARARLLLEQDGADVVEVALPDADGAAKLIMDAEAADYHRAYLRTRASDYTAVTRTRLETAEFIPAVDYVRAQRVRQRAISEVEAILRDVDALLLPANLWVTPGRLPSAITTETEEDKLRVGFPGGRAGGPHIAIFNLTGHPALVVALSRTETGLPIGVQIAGRLYDEQRLLRIATALERKSAWLSNLPELEPKLAEAG
jgi:aspartyl-tRNA(Asn)/glutamyl-tRNA(Gln) amidotransferase subunit A